MRRPRQRRRRHAPAFRCHKLGFTSVEQAERTSALIAGIAAGTKSPPVRLYECPRCGLLHFTSKREEEVGERASTVAELEPPQPILTPHATADSPCASCGDGGARYELQGRLYHRRCRRNALNSLPHEERQRIVAEWCRAGAAQKPANDAEEQP